MIQSRSISRELALLILGQVSDRDLSQIHSFTLESLLNNIDNDIYEDGHILLDKLEPLGRLAGNWYTRPTDNLKITRQEKPK